MFPFANRCRGCDDDYLEKQGQWWNLSGYHGFRGLYCGDCYDKIAHDSYGNPVNPAEYIAMLLKKREYSVLQENNT
jgi:hypothetical protein